MPDFTIHRDMDLPECWERGENEKAVCVLAWGLNSTVEEGLAKSPVGTDSAEHKWGGEKAESELVMSPHVFGTLRPPFHSLCSVFITSFSTSFCQHQEAEDRLAGRLTVQPPTEDTQGQGLALNDFPLHFFSLLLFPGNSSLLRSHLSRLQHPASPVPKN